MGKFDPQNYITQPDISTFRWKSNEYKNDKTGEVTGVVHYIRTVKFQAQVWDEKSKKDIYDCVIWAQDYPLHWVELRRFKCASFMQAKERCEGIVRNLNRSVKRDV